MKTNYIPTIGKIGEDFHVLHPSLISARGMVSPNTGMVSPNTGMVSPKYGDGIIPAAMELNVAGHQSSGYTVTIPVYEGPLDLLLQLIEHAELDITAVALAQVTDQYLAYIHQMQIPAEEISAFLVVAAKLLQIKSEALLPRAPVREEGEEDPGDELARQLQIYKRFKELAAWLDERVNRHLRTYLRVAPPLITEGHLDMTGISLADLAAAAEGIFGEEAEKQSLGTIISAPRITIREKIALIAERLSNQSNVPFRSLLGESPSRLEVVVTFLALLELIKRYRVGAQQTELFSEIEIEKMEDWGKDEELEIEFE
jgi:segregation and condensation protein A